MTTTKRRSGMTLMEVLLAMAIFLIGSVSLVGLFVTASALHADAMNRRRAAFIADELLAEVRSLRFREVFAKTTLSGTVNVADTTIPVLAVYANNLTPANQGSDFDFYPVHYLLNAATTPVPRLSGPILIEGEGGAPGVPREWAWYDGIWPATNTFNPVARGLWGTGPVTLAHWPTGSSPPPAPRVLQPRSWRFVLNAPLANNASTVQVKGDPTVAPAAPPTGYIVIDEEWMPYASCTPTAPGEGRFNVAQNTNGVYERGWGGTGPSTGVGVTHLAGTPVTVAREHPFYPGFYYTVQFYPADATGASSQVIISVGYGNANLFRVHTFHTIYTPTSY
jgi:prepilin-type N-terminal cleavage/methylation domain-containing protein